MIHLLQCSLYLTGEYIITVLTFWKKFQYLDYPQGGGKITPKTLKLSTSSLFLNIQNTSEDVKEGQKSKKDGGPYERAQKMWHGTLKEVISCEF